MNAEVLLREFARTADGPDSVARIRRFVLALAVRGRLSDQAVSDEPALHLVEALRAARTRVRASRHELPPLTDEEKPFVLPASWEWMRFGDACDYDAGDKRNAAQLDPESWLLELEDIERDTSTILAFHRVKDRHPQSTKSAFKSGDVLYGKLRPYLNKVVVARDAGYSTTEIVAIRPFVPMSSEYICLALRRPDFVDYVTHLGRGTKMPRLRTQDALLAPFPLPPIAEQLRIVAKVDVLMAVCDQLDSMQREREVRRERLRAVSLQRLTRFDGDGGTSASDVRSFLNRSSQLITAPDHVAAVRQALLDLAASGRLITHDHAFGISDARRPRASWVELPLGDLLAEDSRNGYSRKPDGAADGIPILKISAATLRTDGIVAEEEHKLIGMVSMREREQYRLFSGDLLACRFNGNRESVGRLAIFRDSQGLDAIFPDKLIRLRVDRTRVLPDLLRWFSHSTLFRSRVAQFAATTVGNWGISAANLKKVLIPCPPLEEQHPMLAKVDELMAACDELEAALTSAQQGRSRLHQALLNTTLENSAVYAPRTKLALLESAPG